MKQILVSGLNPAWQKTLVFDKLTLDEVNRAKTLHSIASGKGVNFSRAVSLWGKAVSSVLHPLGGVTGKQIIESMGKEGLTSVSITTEAATRTCSTLMSTADGTATEIIEPSGMISAEEYEKLMMAARMEIGSSDALAICGTYPPGIPEQCYADLISMAAEKGKTVLLDAYKGIGNALFSGVTILKINRGELLTMTGKNTIEEGIRACLETYPVEVVAITSGKDQAMIGTREKITGIVIPQISNAINPIGAGDTCAGVFLSEYLCGTAPEEAFACGLCAATASCMTDTPAKYDKNIALELKKKIEFFNVKG
ncbi:MAG: hypothetical protein IKB25_06740 [Lentisphaeria bacterium]|nr:hypothetical protein [Lentisphaeria bacterium]